MTALTFLRALAAAASVLALAARAAPQADSPSHPAFKDCKWEKLADPAVGLAAWVMRCDYGFRRIDFAFKGNALTMRYSDGGEPEPVIEVLDLKPGESPDAGVRRLFAERTDKALAARCVVAPWRGAKAPAGIKRYTVVPDAAYAKELKAKSDPNEVGDPPCGDWGESPDGIQYFEAQPNSGARKLLFVRVGQDDPLFDERTLKLLPPPASQ